MIKLFKKQKLGKKASESSAGLEMPMQTFIELLLILSVGFVFVIYGSYVINDLKMYQVYLSKDISFLQNTIVLVEDNILTMYSPPAHSKLNHFHYIFKPTYTDVIFIDDEKQNLNDGVIKSYIHFAFNPSSNNLRNNIILNNPDKIYFYRMGETYNIGIDWRNVMSGWVSARKCNSLYLDRNTYFYFDYSRYKVEDIILFRSLNSVFLNKEKYISTNEMNFYSFNNMQVSNKAFFIFDKIDAIRPSIRIYSPQGKEGVFGCMLFNGLVSKHITNLDLSFIETNNLPYFNYNFNHSVYIMATGDEIGLIIQTINEIINEHENI
jgi:hypothetical protein